MKKHDEGYILAYVLVTLTVICMIAVSAMTVPMTNLRIQKAAIEKMQQQYTAQGKIEQLIGLLEDAGDKSVTKFITADTLLNFLDECEVQSISGQECQIYFAETEGRVRISIVLWIKGDKNIQYTEENGKYTITGVIGAPEYKFISYSIASAEGGGMDEQT